MQGVKALLLIDLNYLIASVSKGKDRVCSLNTEAAVNELLSKILRTIPANVSFENKHLVCSVPERESESSPLFSHLHIWKGFTIHKNVIKATCDQCRKDMPYPELLSVKTVVSLMEVLMATFATNQDNKSCLVLLGKVTDYNCVIRMLRRRSGKIYICCDKEMAKKNSDQHLDPDIILDFPLVKPPREFDIKEDDGGKITEDAKEVEEKPALKSASYIIKVDLSILHEEEKATAIGILQDSGHEYLDSTNHDRIISFYKTEDKAMAIIEFANECLGKEVVSWYNRPASLPSCLAPEYEAIKPAPLADFPPIFIDQNNHVPPSFHSPSQNREEDKHAPRQEIDFLNVNNRSQAQLEMPGDFINNEVFKGKVHDTPNSHNRVQIKAQAIQMCNPTPTEILMPEEHHSPVKQHISHSVIEQTNDKCFQCSQLLDSRYIGFECGHRIHLKCLQIRGDNVMNSCLPCEHKITDEQKSMLMKTT